MSSDASSPARLPEERAAEETFARLLTEVVNAAFDCGAWYESDDDDGKYADVIARSKAARRALTDHVTASARRIAELEAENASLRESAEDLFDERTRLRETAFFFASVIRSGEPWTEHCDAALEKATAALGSHRSATLTPEASDANA